MSSYFEWVGFKDLYLEDSFVLGIDEKEGEIKFKMEFVLREKHPLYNQPKQGEEYCYKKGSIIFEGVRSIEWLERNDTYFIDASGEEDYGNIDIFELKGSAYFLSGDWGRLKLESLPPKVNFD